MTSKKEQSPAEPEGGEKIHHAMLAIMGEIGAIEKERTVSGFGAGYKFRGIDQVYSAIHPLMIKHRVYMRAEVLDKSREERIGSNSSGKQTVTAFTSLRMRYHFVAADGSSVFTEAEGEGMDSGDKSSNKAMAVAHKYAILQAFCVPTEAMDDTDTEVHEVQPRHNQASQAAAFVVEVDDATAIPIIQAAEASKSIEELKALWDRNADKLAALKTQRPEDYKKCEDAKNARKNHFTSQTKAA